MKNLELDEASNSHPRLKKPLEVLDEGSGDASGDAQPPQPRHPVVEAISAPGDNPESVRAALEANPGCLEWTDETGMTPIMHAAWKGKPKTVRMLIDMGADVNGGRHEHDYSPLHFAALAGKAEVCQLLVGAGAKVDAVNSVKRTAAQMAAFVGNSHCVAVINNFVPKEAVYYFTRKQPLEDEAKLKPHLAKLIHKLVMSMNVHPVRVGLFLKHHPDLLSAVSKACRILELMSDREFRDRRDVNEILSLKFHVIHYILRDVDRQKCKFEASAAADGGGGSKTPFIDLWIRSMLVGRESDGFAVFQEDFLRQAVKEFPYQESTLFKALVTNFSHCRNYGEGVTAAEYINQSFNGQSGFKDDDVCTACGNTGQGREEAIKKCTACKSVQYCDQECQKFHWFTHKKACKKLRSEKS